MKSLIAIVSCQQHRDLGYHDAIRNTWINDIQGRIDYKFFYGFQHYPTFMFHDEQILSVDDSYQGLHLKTYEICHRALEMGYDYVYKTDTDTLVNVSNLLWSGFEQHDYMGSANADVVPLFGPEPLDFASGGAGYWLSKKALTIVVNYGITGVCGEDVFVANALKHNGISPVWHEGYKWRPGEQITKDTVSLHLSSALQKKYRPEMMYEQYEKMKEKK